MEIAQKAILTPKCPSCNKYLLFYNELTEKYDCANCNESYLKATVEKYNQAPDVAKNTDNANAIAWFNNDYFNTKKKKWVKGKQPTKIKLKKIHLWAILATIIALVVINLVLEWFIPGTKIFFW